MGLIQKFDSQFMVKTVPLDEGKERIYIFDRNSMDDEKLDAIVNSFHGLYDADILDCSFNDYLDQLQVEYMDLGTLE